ncbi:SLC13 family permease [Litorihabitans aurantiacus]|uniref:Arsenic transport integral membrane protein ArsB n=1 Tax=Litorihabitans aurantiacus TaxID=1930061 RepID=A0AA38CTN3_9MICO|nr:SLC13 family permease [Litorihabitans aurantiacus]GMA31525.1 arsenic transport integral membrane protein ArsB [Litorihabitans aurantiacus]
MTMVRGVVVPESLIPPRYDRVDPVAQVYGEPVQDHARDVPATPDASPSRRRRGRPGLGRPWWALALVVGVVVVATGLLPRPEATALAERTGPVLLFLAALTVVSELCAGAGLFAAAAGLAARVAAGRRWLLWVLVVVLATLSTAVLSLDTTAVLLTPVVIALARRTGTSPLPFALAVVALANTASLVLPVSNLTNLLADHALRAAGGSFLALMWAPALAAILVTVAVLGVRDRRELRGRYETPPAPEAPDPALLRIAAVVVAVMALAFVLGVEPAVAATVAAVALLVATRVRRRPLPVPAGDLVPWRTLVVVAALFVVVAALRPLGEGLTVAAGTGDGPLDLLRLAAVAALASNAVNNLPAFLALDPAVAGEPLRIAALLIGSGVAPIMTPWGSLATVLWWQRCRQAMLEVPLRTLVRQGLVLAPLALLASVGALVLVG